MPPAGWALSACWWCTPGVCDGARAPGRLRRLDGGGLQSLMLAVGWVFNEACFAEMDNEKHGTAGPACSRGLAPLVCWRVQQLFVPTPLSMWPGMRTRRAAAALPRRSMHGRSEKQRMQARVCTAPASACCGLCMAAFSAATTATGNPGICACSGCQARPRRPCSCPPMPPCQAPAPAAANMSIGGPAWDAGVAPPVITYLMAMNHEPVVNNGEVGSALRQSGSGILLVWRGGGQGVAPRPQGRRAPHFCTPAAGSPPLATAGCCAEPRCAARRCWPRCARWATRWAWLCGRTR